MERFAAGFPHRTGTTVALAVLLAARLAPGTGCTPAGRNEDAPAAGRPPLTVAAAASLAPVLPELLDRWTARSGTPTRLVLDASSRLARQIEAGAPYDVFVSADRRWPQRLVAEGHLERNTQASIARSEIVLVVPAGVSCSPFEDVADLLPRFERIAAAEHDVPAGRAADRALALLGLRERLGDRLVRAPHVRAVARWVERGEVDAGFVYESEVRASPALRMLARLPEAASEDLEVTVALVHRPDRPREAADLARWLASETVRSRLRRAGWR